MPTIEQSLAQELAVQDRQVSAAVKLLDEGATVPFIARYRKEVTGGLSDTQLRTLADRLTYLRELEDRKATILKSIEEQGKLTPELRHAITSADTKTILEDLYLPYKPKRRNKAQIAREAGLEPLAQTLLNSPHLDPQATAQRYVNPSQGIETTDQALEGAQEILMETFSEHAELLGFIRQRLWQSAQLTSTLVKGKETEGAKFRDYFQFAEPLKRVPSHRALAIFRGTKEGFLKHGIDITSANQTKAEAAALYLGAIARRFRIENQKRPADPWLWDTVEKTWKKKIFPHLETDLLRELKESADEEAIRVFAENLKNLLLASPAGHRITMGLDPGLRTGTKVVVIDKTGKVLTYTTIYPHPPQNQVAQSTDTLVKLIQQHHVELISIGNGTGSRETDRLIADLIKQHPDLKLQKIMVSEAGASVYSASELASNELPDLDVSIRGAVSIARRLQDPLAELVKIEPKAIGVGQYQHDVNQTRLGQMLGNVVEDCVNSVGVDVNTASVALLSYVAGLSSKMAQNLVAQRNQSGAFRDRSAILKVSGIGPKAFEQAAGFLRIPNGANPLDASAVHPESYPVVEKILSRSGQSIQQVIGNTAFLKSLNPADYATEKFGLPTIQDILAELEKPGRDPRPEFKTATFKEGVETLSDLQAGMLLEGVVTNVTNFGAFVDIGVHQDGLVHVSQLADKFVKDPADIVKTGQVVKVKVVEVDIPRKRISLTMKLTTG